MTFGRALIGVIFACPKCSSLYVVMQERRPDRPDLLDANVAGFSKCDSHNTMREPLKGVLTKDLDSTAIVRERDDWGYFVRAIRDRRTFGSGQFGTNSGGRESLRSLHLISLRKAHQPSIPIAKIAARTPVQLAF